MDVFTLVLWALRIGFVVCLYLFLAVVVRTLWRDLRSAVATAAPSVGRLIVLASPLGRPEAGTSIPIDAVTSLGGDINNTIVVDDPAVASQQGLLTFRGRGWYLEDHGAGAPMRVNGDPVDTAATMHFGDEIGLGRVRLRLERPLERVDP